MTMLGTLIHILSCNDSTCRWTERDNNPYDYFKQWCL